MDSILKNDIPSIPLELMELPIDVEAKKIDLAEEACLKQSSAFERRRTWS